ncbi:MAG: class I SAM-dependent methyltransferase [Bacteroidia bacterium]
MEKAEWFKDWFNSPYYHVLYKNRDQSEAAAFIDKLSGHLELNAGHLIWDLACGKGRHSTYLNKKGFNVTGTDLSENNIQKASVNANDRLEFYVHDMRTLFRVNYFTHVLNLFTSIGYFGNVNDNQKVFKNVYLALKPGGLFVIDFFNAAVTAKQLPVSEEKTIEGISFRISKKQEGQHIVKRIEFTDGGKNYFFEEHVSILTKKDFERFAAGAGFSPVETFGDYNLNPFDNTSSDRLILIFKK